ncbi:putative mucin/carbohydrate-binding domain-containing protein, partial [Ligilactobacillus equi]
MFAKNNKHELMKKNADRKVRYGIRKLGIGVVSVALSTLFFISNASQVQADVTDSVTNGQLQASEESPTPSEEGLSAEPEGMFEEEENPAPVQPTLEFKDASSLPQSVPTAGVVIPDTEITSWELKGYGDQKFGAVSFTAPVIEPVIGVQKYPRQPHQVYGTDLYAQITVSREDKTIYQKSFTGTDSSSSTDFYEEYQPGDVLSIYHAEPSRISAEQAELLGTALKNAKTYSYRIHEDGLENITDYVELKKEVAKFYADSQKITLAPQKDLSDVAVIRQGIEQDPYLSEANRTELLAEIAKVEETFQNLPGAILPGQGKQVAIFSVPASTITDQEGRPMGRNMDRQALGITLKEGATIRVRVTSAKETEAKNLAVQLIDSDTQKMVNKAVTLDGDWLEVTALADSVAYIKSPTTGDFQVEYEVVSGRVDELPVFTSETDQKQVEKQWDKFKVPYALIVGNNIQIQAPYKDLNLISQKNLGNLLSQYDQIFKEYYSLTNLRANENGVLQIPRYFAAADINGVGAAYYDSSRWIGSNGTSIGPYLNIGWLTLHEIAHGFEIPSATMPIVEIFNNVYGTLYQAKYIYPTNEEFTKSAWIYGRNRERAVERMVNAVENGKGYQGAEYSTRLLMLMNLADYHDNGGQDFRAFNQYHQELVAQGKPANDLGKDWVELFLNQYGINLVDYFDNLGVKLDSSTRLNALQSNKAVAVMLYQVVGENDLPQAMDALGWTDKQLKNKTSLITTADLAKLDLKADTTISLANYQVLAGKQLAIMDGDRVVRTINGDDLIANQGSVDLSQVPVGGYTLKVLDNALQVADPYITIKSGMPNQLQTAVTTTLLPEVEALYTDSSHTTVKPSLTQAQLEAAQSLVDRIENPAIKQLNQALITQAQPDVEEITLKGYGNQTFATINKNEGSDKLVLQTLPGKPQPFYGMNDYVTVEVFDDNGKLLYQRSFKGNEDLVASSIEIPVQEYYQVKVSHKEGASRLVTKLDDQVVIPEKVSSFTVVDGHLMADNTLFIQDGLRGKTPQFEVRKLTQPSDLIKEIKARVNDANGKTYTNANFTVENLDVNTPGSYTVKVKAEVVINGMKRTVEQAYPVVITGIASSEESESDTNPSASSIESVPSQSPTSSPSESSGEVPSETSAESVPSETTTSGPSESSEEVPSKTMPESGPSETTTSGPSESSDVTPSETMPESVASETTTSELSESSDVTLSETTPESVPSESPTSGLNESSEEVPSETTSESVPSESPTSDPSEASDVTPSETTPESGPSETTTSEPSESSEEVPSETTPESVASETTTSDPSETSDVTPSETTPESVASETSTSGPSESSDVTPSETTPE